VTVDAPVTVDALVTVDAPVTVDASVTVNAPVTVNASVTVNAPVTVTATVNSPATVTQATVESPPPPPGVYSMAAARGLAVAGGETCAEVVEGAADHGVYAGDDGGGAAGRLQRAQVILA